MSPPATRLADRRQCPP